MAAFLADQNFEDEVVLALIAEGHTVITVRSIGLDRASDFDVLSAATLAGSAVLTHDRDFIRLHKSGVDHSGIVFATLDDDFAALAGRIHAAVSSTAGSLDGQLIRVYRPA